MIEGKTVYQGRLRGEAIRASILEAACEAVGIQPDAPGVRLRAFRLIGDAKGEWDWPDVDFDLVVKKPRWV